MVTTMTIGIRIKALARFLIHLVGCLSVAWVLLAAGAEAKPTTAEQAKMVVANWLLLTPKAMGETMSQQVKDVQTFADGAGPLFYVVYLEPAGLVFVPADDLVEPILGFAPSTTVFDPSPANPLGALVSRDGPARVNKVRQLEAQARVQGREFAPSEEAQKAQRKWGALAQGLSPREMLDQGLEFGLPSIDDVWVNPIVQSRWAQTTVNDQACYNYYTPPGPDGSAGNYPCGCVATAMAQLMRRWRYPAAPEMGVFPITINGYPQYAAIRGGDGSGGNYHWGLMELDPKTNGVNEAQRQAIGALTYDAGVAAQMSYAADGSGTFSVLAARALTTTFRYSNAIVGQARTPEGFPITIPIEILYNMVNPNLDAGFPVLFGISGSPGGHEIVGDGYGSNWGTMYHHLNLGWANAGDPPSDAWYNLPTIDPAQGTFTSVDDCIYNIYASGAGELISGRVTNACGAPLAGAVVTASGPGGPYTTTASDRGVYAFRVAANSTYTIQVSGAAFSDRTVTTGLSVNDHLTCGNRWGVNFRASRPNAGNAEYVLYSLGGVANKSSRGYGINNQSIVAGAMKVDNSATEYAPCIWLESGIKGLFSFWRAGTDQVKYGSLQGINNRNQAVGWASKTITINGTEYVTDYPINVEKAGSYFELRYMNVPTDLPGVIPHGKAFGINDKDEVVGQAGMSQNDLVGTYPAYWASINPSFLPTTNAGFDNRGGTDDNWASRINSAGQIVGKKKGDLVRAFLWEGDNLTWLGPTDQNREARSLTNLTPPAIVGLLGLFDYATHLGQQAVIFNGTAVQPLAPTGTYGAHGVNRWGQIVGAGSDGAFVYDATNGVRALNSLVNEPDWDLKAAYDINDNGEIVGWGYYKCLSDFAFMLRPLYTITASAGDGGVISPSGAVKIIRGDSVTFNIIPNPGFSIADVMVDGASQGAVTTYTFDGVKANHTIRATFSIGASYTIVATAYGGGKISPSGTIQVNAGDSQTFVITPNPGFGIKDVVVDDTTHLGPVTSYTFGNVNADHTIRAGFENLTFTIRASAGAGGSISPCGEVSVGGTMSQTFTITPFSGYLIANVLVDGTSVGAVSQYTFLDVTADHTIEACFTPRPAYSIMASGGAGGSISPAGAVTVYQGDSQAFTITPNDGYRVSNVVVNGVPQGAVTSFTFNNVMADHTIAASFAAITGTYSITASAGSGGAISPAGTVTVPQGGSQTFAIAPNSGYEVQNVVVDGVSQGKITTYTFAGVTADHTITVTFWKTSTSCQPFFDHFLGSVLGPAWIVKNPVTAAYAIYNSKLHTQTLAGDIIRPHFTDYQNLFLIQNPMGRCDFQLTIKVQGFYPSEDNQEVNIIVYDDDQNFIKCSNIARYWELGSKEDGSYSSETDPADATVSDFYLRLVKVGNHYRQYTSRDGRGYQERNNGITYGTGAPIYLGFIAMQRSSVSATPVRVDIDYFQVERLGGQALPGILELLLLD